MSDARSEEISETRLGAPAGLAALPLLGDIGLNTDLQRS